MISKCVNVKVVPEDGDSNTILFPNGSQRYINVDMSPSCCISNVSMMTMAPIPLGSQNKIWFSEYGLEECLVPLSAEHELTLHPHSDSASRNKYTYQNMAGEAMFLVVETTECLQRPKFFPKHQPFSMTMINIYSEYIMEIVNLPRIHFFDTSSVLRLQRGKFIFGIINIQVESFLKNNLTLSIRQLNRNKMQSSWTVKIPGTKKCCLPSCDSEEIEIFEKIRPEKVLAKIVRSKGDRAVSTIYFNEPNLNEIKKVVIMASALALDLHFRYYGGSCERNLFIICFLLLLVITIMLGVAYCYTQF